jgi:glycosyltransferase involved in cell wall biosynthesis
MVNRPFKYVGIFPVEADPVCFSWSVVLSQMDKPFIISEFGTHEAHKRYIDAAEHIPIGIDSNFWHPATSEEKRSFRESFGIGEDEFVVLTVADNQERKNLAANFRAFATFAKEHPKSRYILVTRENSQVGWKLRDLALDPFGIGDRESTDAGYNISDKLMIFERGMPVTNLWQLYAVSDVFLLLSKAEGLGLPIMESMACGIPVIGTNCTGISELIGPDNLRGFSVGIEYIHIDPFGNGRRYHANSDDAAKILEYIYQNHPIDPNGILPQVIDNARGFIETRTWDKTIEPLLSYLESVDNEKKENTSEESPNE